MISNIISFVSTVKLTGRPVASVCSLGFSRSSFIATGLSGASVVLPGSPVVLPLRKRDERPSKALEAGAVAAEATAYAAVAASAGNQRQMTQHHTMWAFRGLEPWSDPA